MRRISLDGRPAARHWGALMIATLVFVPVLRLIGLPAALLLGSMAAAALLASFHGKVRIPAWSFILAQSVVGCLIARAIGSASTAEMARQWPIFVMGILTVMAFGAALGLLLARWKALPGTTAVWGSSPGGATAMVLMAEAYGADIRLVAVMQYLRVAIVGLVASLVARTWGGSGAALPATDWFPALPPGPFLATLALIAGGAVVGVKSKIPAGALLAPMFIGAVLSASHVVTITLPPWLSGRLLRPGRLVDRPALHPPDDGLRRPPTAADRRFDPDADRALRRPRLCAARRRGHGSADRLSRDQSGRRGFGRDHRGVVEGRHAVRHDDAGRSGDRGHPDRPQPRAASGALGGAGLTGKESEG